MRKMPPKLDESGLWDYALRLLAHRSYSMGELKRKLSLRANSATAVVATVAKLREYGLADDTKFAETFAGSRLRNRGFGRSRVLQELRGRCVSQSLANEVVEKAFAGTDEIQLIERLFGAKISREESDRVLTRGEKSRRCLSEVADGGLLKRYILDRTQTIFADSRELQRARNPRRILGQNLTWGTFFSSSVVLKYASSFWNPKIPAATLPGNFSISILYFLIASL